MHCRYVNMVTENGHIGIFNISFSEMNGLSVADFDAKNRMSK